MKDRNKPLNVAQAQHGVRGPRYRWEWAHQLPPCRFDRLVQGADDLVQAAHHFQHLVKKGPAGVEQARSSYPEVAAAVAMEQDLDKLEKLKIAVLGGLPSAEITSRLDIDEATLKTWEGLFYDVRGSRQAVSWIAAYVVDPELAAGRSELAAKLKLVAAGGAVAARAVLDIDSQAPVTAGVRLFERQLKLHLKFERAVGMTEVPKYHFPFIRLCANLKIQRERLKLEEAKLEQRCSNALCRYELKKISLEAERERAKCQTAREARKAEEAAFVKEGERYAREMGAARLRAFEQTEAEESAERAATSPLNRLRWGDRRPLPVCAIPFVNPTLECSERGPAATYTEPFWQDSRRDTEKLIVAATA